MTWETVPLGELLTDVSTGFASRDDLEEGTFQIRMHNLTSDSRWDWRKRRRVSATARQLNSAAVRRDDIVFNATNSPELVGKSGLVPELDEAAVISNHFLRLRTDKTRLAPAYLQYWLQKQFQAGVFRAKAKSWINQATLDRAVLLSMPIPCPPLPEQRRIAAILDEADALRHKRSVAAKKLVEFPLARFQSLDRSQWRRVRVGDVADLQGGLTLNARRASFPMSAGYLRVANVYRGSIDMGDVKHLGVSEPELLRTRLRSGDVLVVEGHGNIDEVGRAAMVESVPDQPLTHQNHLFRLRPKPGLVNGRFLELSINAPAAREQLKRTANTTSGLNTLNASGIRSLVIHVAPIAVQRTIESEHSAVMASLREVLDHQGRLDALFISLQHRAFRGEL